MKVGVLTFYRGPNYGGYLQASHLLDQIRLLGHEAEIIPYKNSEHLKADKVPLFLTRSVPWMKSQWEKRRAWNQFYRDFHPDEPKTKPEEVDWDDYSHVVVGSDVVWDYTSSVFGQDPSYFGVVPGRQSARWIAYAPSCGVAPADRLPNQLRESLKKFHKISVRDENTATLVSAATGQLPQQVVDPTWLPSSIKPPQTEECDKILAIYAYHDISQDYVREIKDFAKRHDLEIVSYGFFKSWADRNVTNLHPRDWVEDLRKSYSIVTGTFHGTLYALRMGKPFVTLSNRWIRNKVQAPIRATDNDHKLLTNPSLLTPTLEEQLGIGFCEGYEKVTELRERSAHFLRDALNRED